MRCVCLLGSVKLWRVLKLPEQFLALSLEARRDILASAPNDLGLPALVLEKDVWICWVLKHLFENPNRLPMVFKGGTSLSKVFDIIRRMSEDLDITVDCRSAFEPLNARASRNQKDKRKLEIQEFLRKYWVEHLQPHLTQMAKEHLGITNLEFEIETDERVWMSYPSAVQKSMENYIPERILLEFGGRNITEPNAQYTVDSYLGKTVLADTLDFPQAKVIALVAERTLWEKITLLHAESHRPEFTANAAERMSRHWYDVYKLVGTDICERSLSDRALLESVVAAKEELYRSSYSSYQLCLEKQFKLLPDKDGLKTLSGDFRKMIEAGMFFPDEDPSFDKIIETIRGVEQRLNL